MIYPLVTGMMTVIVMLVTVLIGHLCTRCHCYTYFCTLIPILVAELILGSSLMITALSKRRNMIFFAGMPAVAFCYFIFTLLMIFAFGIGMALTPMLIIHIIALLLVVLLFGMFGMAANHSNETQASFANKKMFILEIERFKAENAELLASSADLKAQVDEIADALRYASDSVKGAEQADGKLSNAIDQLHEAAAAGNIQLCIDAAAKVIRLNNWRQTVIKEMR